MNEREAGPATNQDIADVKKVLVGVVNEVRGRNQDKHKAASDGLAKFITDAGHIPHK